jgi:predicted nucleotidyltransferase
METARLSLFRIPSEAEKEAFLTALSGALAAESRVRTAFVFGSFVREGSFRDVDIGLEFDEPFTLLEVSRLADRLWAAVGRPDFELDVVPLNDAPPTFRLEVDSTGRVVRERSAGDALEFGVRARSEWIDLREALSSGIR